jgi:HD-like signal output (HDOD) protein
VSDAEVDKIVAKIGIPPCPHVILDFMEEMRRDDPDFRKLSGLVSSDAALAAAVIKTANSPIYGLRVKATTVQQACTYLGLRSTALLISGLLLRRAFPVEKSQAMEALWQSSTETAASAATLARMFSGVDHDTAYTYCLFRDCGQAVLLQAYPDYTPFVDGSARAGAAPLTAAEDARYPVNHARVGAQLAHSWGLPDALCEAIRHHHAYAEAGSGKLRLPQGSARLIALGAVSEHLASLRRRHKPADEWALARALVGAELGVTERHLGPLAAAIAESRESEPA